MPDEMNAQTCPLFNEQSCQCGGICSSVGDIMCTEAFTAHTLNVRMMKQTTQIIIRRIIGTFFLKTVQEINALNLFWLIL